MTAPSSAPETTREPSGLLAFAGAQRAAALPGRLAPANWDPAMRRQAIGVRHILDAADRRQHDVTPQGTAEQIFLAARMVTVWRLSAPSLKMGGTASV